MRLVLLGILLFVAIVGVLASIVVPIVFLLGLDDEELSRWSNIGQAMQPIGVLFSGVAFMAIAITLFFQRADLNNQREGLRITREEQQRSSEIALRQLHNDIIKMAIQDADLLSVWPQFSPGVVETKKDHYCNLILNLQKVAHETGTIGIDELRGALMYLMSSPDLYSFWTKARAARGAVTVGDEGEDFFTTEVDKAYSHAKPIQQSLAPTARSGPSMVRSLLDWIRR
ncbi:MAG: DUF6082 family protein [Pseudonocardiaceae bacterium]